MIYIQIVELSTINIILKVYHLSELKDIFSATYTALSIAIILPVCNISLERAYSKLKLVKYNLKITISEDRLEYGMWIRCTNWPRMCH